MQLTKKLYTKKDGITFIFMQMAERAWMNSIEVLDFCKAMSVIGKYIQLIKI